MRRISLHRGVHSFFEASYCSMVLVCMTQVVSPFCTYWLVVVIVRVTLQLVRAQMPTATTTINNNFFITIMFFSVNNYPNYQNFLFLSKKSKNDPKKFISVKYIRYNQIFSFRQKSPKMIQKIHFQSNISDIIKKIILVYIDNIWLILTFMFFGTFWVFFDLSWPLCFWEHFGSFLTNQNRYNFGYLGNCWPTLPVSAIGRT